MVEESNFFGSKMLEIEDSINVTNQNIIYYQKSNGEQLDFSVESSLPSYIYSASSDKYQNHTLVIDGSQLDTQKQSNTRWIIQIDLKTILSDYLFTSLKRYRTFEGLKTSMTKTNDINSSINEYINQNVLNRYKYDKINLYIQYKDLRQQSVLRYQNVWNENIVNDSNKFSKIQTELSFDDSQLKVTFVQDKSSDQYSFEYYFNILFVKI
jgi:hypothetical protein